MCSFDIIGIYHSTFNPIQCESNNLFVHLLYLPLIKYNVEQFVVATPSKSCLHYTYSKSKIDQILHYFGNGTHHYKQTPSTPRSVAMIKFDNRTQMQVSS